MKKKVIQINGFSGILMMVFIVTCLIAGFIGFPSLVCMLVWNYFAAKFMFNTITFIGGLLLWGMTAVSFLIFNKKNLIVSFGIPSNMSKEEISELFRRAETENPEEVLRELENRHSEK
ncbi:hypothetical protein IJ732_06435 [bacterium]|nr:hypothetical protein [bacterium]